LLDLAGEYCPVFDMPDGVKAGRQWLAENHPPPAVYMAALVEEDAHAR
jgi:hypothetical protein